MEQVDGKWWFVDPDGHLFYSTGSTGMGAGSGEARLQGREDFFQALPPVDPAPPQGRRPQTGFYTWNLQRRHGDEWRTKWIDLCLRRLESWGLNTIGNWSDETTRLLRRTPYTDTVNSRGAKAIEGSEGYWGKFPDVFDPSFSNQLQRAMVSKRGGTANDPWCLGYFSDNEMSWGDDTSLAMAALKSPPEQAAISSA